MVLLAGSAVSKTILGWINHDNVKTTTQNDTHNAIFCTVNKENDGFNVHITGTGKRTMWNRAMH